MWNRNSILAGLVIAILLPVAGFALLYFGYNQLEAAGIVSERGFSNMFRERTTSIIAICLNLLPLNQFQKRRATQSMRGVVLATTLFVIIWVIYFGRYILS
jgi:Co/Zn/Cd efflux system component